MDFLVLWRLQPYLTVDAFILGKCLIKPVWKKYLQLVHNWYFWILLSPKDSLLRFSCQQLVWCSLAVLSSCWKNESHFFCHKAQSASWPFILPFYPHKSASDKIGLLDILGICGRPFFLSLGGGNEGICCTKPNEEKEEEKKRMRRMRKGKRRRKEEMKKEEEREKRRRRKDR